MNAPVEVEHVDHVAAEEPVDDVADDAGIEQRLGNSSQNQPAPSRVFRHKSKDRLPLPDQKRQRDESKNGEWPDLPLKQAPGATTVLDIGEVEEPRNDGNSRGSLEASPGDFLDNSVDEHEVRDRREDDEEALHFASRSIAL